MPDEDEIHIKIYPSEPNNFGSVVEVKREPLAPIFETITAENRAHYFALTPLPEYKRQELEDRGR